MSPCAWRTSHRGRHPYLWWPLEDWAGSVCHTLPGDENSDSFKLHNAVEEGWTLTERSDFEFRVIMNYVTLKTQLVQYNGYYLFNRKLLETHSYHFYWLLVVSFCETIMSLHYIRKVWCSNEQLFVYMSDVFLIATGQTFLIWVVSKIVSIVGVSRIIHSVKITIFDTTRYLRVICGILLRHELWDNILSICDYFNWVLRGIVIF